MGTIERTFSPPVADECQYPTGTVDGESAPFLSQSGDSARKPAPTEYDEISADYFLREGERARQDRVIREFLSSRKA